MNNIPVSQTNLGGNKVSDLVEALLKLDQDIKVDVQNVRVEYGMLALDEQRFIDKFNDECNIDWVIDQFNAECATDVLSLDDLIMCYQDLVEERDKLEKQLDAIRELLDE